MIKTRRALVHTGLMPLLGRNTHDSSRAYGFSLLFKVTDDGRGTVIDLTKEHGTVEGGVGKHGGIQVRLTGMVSAGGRSVSNQGRAVQ